MNTDGLSEHHRAEAEKEIDVIAEKIDELKASEIMDFLNRKLKELPWFPGVFDKTKIRQAGSTAGPTGKMPVPRQDDIPRIGGA